MRKGRAENAWRWALRITGLGSFLLCGVLLILRGEVPVPFLFVGAMMMGLDSIHGFEVRRRDDK